MKSKCLVWFLVFCVLGVTTVSGQYDAAKTVSTQTQDNLSRDVILVPVNVSELDSKSLQQSTEPFSINATFAGNVTNQQRAVFQQAINEWTAIIQTRGFTPGNYPITFSNGAQTGNTLAVTTTKFNRNNGNLISAAIVFDNRSTTTWYVDPNPADDGEFNAMPPPAGFDLLSVARHELGHALGWSDTERVTDLLSGNIFDVSRLNIGTVSTGGRHTDPSIHVNDIMIPFIPASTRRPISLYPAAAMVARAFFYDITMRFVDRAYTHEETGSANEPWNTLREGADLTPLDRLLLLATGTYNETVPLTLSRRMTIRAARGAGAVIGQSP